MGARKSIAFYTCTNGLGHYKRVSEVALHLVNDHDVTIYCNKSQAEKIGTVGNVEYIYYTQDNIKWDLVTNGESDKAIDSYLSWLLQYGSTVKNYDIVISDNLAGLCQYGNVVLMGSFFWKDVFKSYLGNNRLTRLDERTLLDKHPTVITNKYVETQSMKEYPHKFQTGFGELSSPRIAHNIEYLYYQNPSNDYGLGYSRVIDKIARLDIPYIKSGGDIPEFPEATAIIARPGVGTITHCVKNQIPLIALYSTKDSEEIIELAHIVEELKIGFKQDIDEPLRLDKFKMMNSNTIFCYAEKFEDEGYRKIANYIEEL